MHAQAGKAGGGRVIEEQKKQNKRQQKQTSGSETRVSLDPAGTVSVDGVEARIPAICAHPQPLVLPFAGYSSFSQAYPLCIGRTGVRAC